MIKWPGLLFTIENMLQREVLLSVAQLYFNRGIQGLSRHFYHINLDLSSHLSSAFLAIHRIWFTLQTDSPDGESQLWCRTGFGLNPTHEGRIYLTDSRSGLSLLTHQLSKLINELRHLKLVLRKGYIGCTDSWDPKLSVYTTDWHSSKVGSWLGFDIQVIIAESPYQTTKHFYRRAWQKRRCYC